MTEKLQAQIGLKLTLETSRIVHGLAEIEGITASSWIRNLVEKEVSASQAEFDLKREIFGSPSKPE